ncbi:unnamed protein product, partial [Sphagnum compactum]
NWTMEPAQYFLTVEPYSSYSYRTGPWNQPNIFPRLNWSPSYSNQNWTMEPTIFLLNRNWT